MQLVRRTDHVETMAPPYVLLRQCTPPQRPGPCRLQRVRFTPMKLIPKLMPRSVKHPKVNENRPRGEPAFSLGWALFLVLAIFDRSVLASVYHWVRDLPWFFEMFAWFFGLPYMVALAIAEGGWQTWLKIVTIVLVAVMFGGALRSGGKKSR